MHKEAAKMAKSQKLKEMLKTHPFEAKILGKIIHSLNGFYQNKITNKPMLNTSARRK